MQSSRRRAEGVTAAMVEYDPYSDDVQHNPYPIYRQLRDEAPVYHNEQYDFYALSRYDDVLATIIDFEHFTTTQGVSLERAEVGQDLLILKDPPEHTWYRKAMARMFTPRTIAELEPFIRRVTVDLLDDLQRHQPDHFDVTADFALKLPLYVIAELIGLPDDYRVRARELSELTARRDPSPDIMARTIEHMTTFREYLIGVTAERRRHLGDDIVSTLITQPIVDGEGNEHHLTDDEISFFFFELTFAGHETTAKSISNAMVALSWYPDQRRELAADLALVPDAVEEFLRWDTVSHYLTRTPLEDTTRHGVTIPAGRPVACMIASANHDERQYDNPELLDIHRRINRGISFGFGPHVCIGAALARIEMRIAFEEFLARFPDFHVGDATAIVRAPSAQIRGLTHLPLEIEKSGAGV
jgi:cytochrome P450